MTERRLRVYPYFAAALAAVAIACLFLWPFGLMFFVIIIGVLLMETLVLRFSRREILKRSLPAEYWWNWLALPVIVLCAAASAGLSVYDAVALHFSPLPSFYVMMGGVFLLMGAVLIAAQSLRSQPPHAEDEYGEEPQEGRERGPYEVIRHPMMLAVLMGGLSIPMFLGSGIGFIPIGIMLVTVIARVAAEDDWRFNSFEWYYDYTKAVSYRLIPFIW